ncbi:MAG: UDP-3-O-(3-hydroxymyristoyl)glucosamine N-acyltransferase [Nitrospirae bacterium]|nr:MAG: UDP-3-O-(3-hydroxymyristoyl)glucosamine N-acyltransferase [Nitrospirota bacterium]
MKLSEFADRVQGTITGDPATEITGVSGIEGAGPGDITFMASSKFLKQLRLSAASCVIVKENVADLAIPQLRVENPYFAFAKALEYFYPRTEAAPLATDRALIAADVVLGRNVTVFPLAYISEGASIGDGTVIYPGVFIGRNVRIGRDCIIHPQVTIREECTLADRVIIHAGSVIGSDGFGYVFEKGEHYKIPQVGRVEIGDDVEIGSNVSIDRATLGSTVIGRGTKIDNLVQIAHNVLIGEDCIIVSQVGISGSCSIGSHVTIAGQAGLADHTTIDPEVIIGARAATMGGHVTKGFYLGAPVAPHREFMKAQSFFLKLPEMNKKMKDLEERLSTLEKENKKNVVDN